MASLPIFKTDDRISMMQQNSWARTLNPVLANPLTSGYILKNVPLVTGSNTINHLQGGNLNGYLIVGMHGAYAEIYDTTSPTPALTLILHSSANTTVDIYVF